MSIEVDGLDHGMQPFPMASRRGPLLCTSAVHGRDPDSGELLEDPSGQVRQVFANLERVLAAGGGTLADVVLVQISVANGDVRPLVNEIWVQLFPDADSRPARNTQVRTLNGGQICTVMATAYVF
ncbi:RidA family protein [Nocardioides sp.]|uniref:RidA family protein n=1 Tax=Nocardioides sp. TaxID=35761 RepID=UPI003D09950F